MYLLADLIVILVFLIGAAALGFLLGRRSTRAQSAEWQRRLSEQQHRLTDAQTKLKRTLGQRLALEQELTEVRTHLSGQGIDVADIQSAIKDEPVALAASEATTAEPANEAIGRLNARKLNRQPSVRRTRVTTPPARSTPSPQDETLQRIRARAASIDFDRIGTAEAGQRDDLKRIENIGIYTEKKLNALGIRTFDQIANFNERDQQVVNRAIELSSGRIARDGWVEQARRLVEDLR